MLQKIKAVIWDVDGTMVDSQPLHDRSWNKALAEYGYSFADISPEILKHKAGKKPINIAEEFVTDIKLLISPSELFKIKNEYFMSAIRNELEPMSDLTETIKSMNQSGYRQAIGSSMTAEYVSLILDMYQLKNYFEIIVTGEQVTKGKPDPEIYLSVSKKLKLQPNECVVIEDATSGIKAAKGAGCLCIALLNPDEVEDLSEADSVIKTLTEIRNNLPI